MKKLKTILSAMLALILMITPFAFVGCKEKDTAKRYTLSVSKEDGEGYVYNRYPEADKPVNPIYGDTDYVEGSVVEITVVPASHYEITSVQVKKGNGEYEDIDITVAAADKDTGTIRRTISTSVDSHYSVKVSFGLKTYNLTFYYLDGEDYVPLMDGTEVYTISKTHNETKTIENLGSFGFLWYARQQGGGISTELTPCIFTDDVVLTRDTALYAPEGKTLQDLKDLLGLD